MRLLLVEDDPFIQSALSSTLRQSGYQVDCAGDGELADTALLTHQYDLVILDLTLPKLDGITLLRRLRRRITVPVLIISARDTPADRVVGLDAGADDYLIKPFDLPELEARVRALLRRGQETCFTSGKFLWDWNTRTAYLDGEVFELSARESSVLALLLQRPGKVVPKNHLVDKLTQWDGDISQNAVEVYVHRLRHKLEACGLVIRTIRGLGYILETNDDLLQ